MIRGLTGALQRLVLRPHLHWKQSSQLLSFESSLCLKVPGRVVGDPPKKTNIETLVVLGDASRRVNLMPTRRHP